MRREEWNDLAAFMAVADAGGFTRAAASLGISPSALSHALKALEGRLGVRLLARTTRSVAPTEAGERLLRTLRPAFAEVGAELVALAGLRDKPAGTLRLTTSKHAATAILAPMLPGFLTAFPDIRVEVSVDAGLVDIVAGRFDAGLRFGEKVAGDMVAVRVGPVVRSVVVGSPAYFARRGLPVTPDDLADHSCINYRLPTKGLYPWEFDRAGLSFQLRVEGRLVLNDADLVLGAALAGQGLAQLFEDQVADHVAAGRLRAVLADWRWTEPGYCLYYANRRQIQPVLAAFIDALRSRPAQT